jgi:molybdate transport system substrate-binding protein
LGVADILRPKLTIKAAIDGGADLVAKGAADIGMYLASEVMAVKGVTLVGLLPPAMQSFVIYGTAIPVYNSAPEPALSFVRFMSDVDRRDKWTAAGFDLLSPKN